MGYSDIIFCTSLAEIPDIHYLLCFKVSRCSLKSMGLPMFSLAGIFLSPQPLDYGHLLFLYR